jgi:putative transposase
LPENDFDCAQRWNLIKGGFSRGLPAAARSASQVAKREKGIWQRRYWEHAIRNETDLARHIDYVHFNPHSPDDALIMATRTAIQI